MKDPASCREKVKKVPEAGAGGVGFFAFSAVLVMILAFTSPAFATDRTWTNAGTSGWGTNSNWSGGAQPTSSDDAYINNGGTATVTLAGEVANNLYLGDTGTGSVSMSGSGALVITNGLYVGVSGIGNFTQSAGTSTVPNLYIGVNGGSTGTVTLSGGTMNLTNLSLGSGTSNLNMSGTAVLNYTGSTWDFTNGTFTAGVGGNRVDFKGTGAQSLISGNQTYNNITHSAAGTLTLNTNDLIVGNAFTNSAGTFNANGLNTTVTGLTSLTGGIYQAGSGIQTFNGGVTIAGGTLTGSTGDITTTFMNLSTGTLNAPTGAFNVSGNWAKTGGTFTHNSGTVTFNKTSGTQTLNSGGTTAASQFYNIEHTGAGTLQLLTNNLVTTGTFTNSAGTFDANGRTHTVTGLTTLSGGDYLAKTAQQTFNGGLLINGGTLTGSTGGITTTNMDLSSGTLTAPSGIFNVSGNWEMTGGTFTPGANTVTFNKASGTQTLDSTGSFFNLTHSGAGTLQLAGSGLSSTGTLTQSTGTFDANTNDANINANIVTISGGTFDASDSADFNVSGNWSKTAGTFNHNSGTVTFTGTSGTQTLNSGGAGAGSQFYNVEKTGAGTLQLSTNTLSTTGTFTLSDGIFNGNGRLHTVTGLATISGGTYQTGTAQQTFNGGLLINGGTYAGGTGNTTTTDLTLSSGTFTAPSGPLNVSGDLTISGGTFNPGTGTVTLNKTVAGTQNLTSGGQSFYNLTHSTFTNLGTVVLQDDLHVINNFQNNGGILHANGKNITVGGTFTQSNGLVTFRLQGGEAISSPISANGIVEYYGDGGNTAYSTLAAGSNYATLLINSTSGNNSFETGGNLTVGTELHVQSGTLLQTANTTDVANTFTVDGGTYKQTGGTLNLTTSFGNGTVTSGGVLEIDGQMNGFGYLNVTNGGTLKGTGTLFQVMTDISAGGILAPGNSPGTLMLDTMTMTLGEGAVWNIEISDAMGVAGTDWDLIQQINGATLDITATNLDPVTINIIGLSSLGPDVEGNALNFNSSGTYSFLIADATDGFITGFAANKFDLVIDGDFTAANPSLFSISQAGGNLYLNYNGEGPAVPELPSGAGIALLAFLGAGLLWIRKRKAAVSVSA